MRGGTWIHIIIYLMIGVSILISYALIRLLSFVIDIIKNRPDRLLNPTEYFPEEEVKTLKQVYYLILIFTILLTISNFFFDNNILLSNNPEFYAFNSFFRHHCFNLYRHHPL